MKIANFEVGLDQPFFLIVGPCVIESREFALETAKMIADITGELGINALYKSSFDKANRTSGSSFRGPGIEEGLEILAEVRETVGIPVLTDVHTPEQVHLAAKYVDMIQTPAFLCRQTDLIEAVGACGIPANIKKGQFLSPQEMVNVTKKA
ncbi:MAG: 2-dehydro-3-deoxyphosphooctonate aldolase (KDO 8-P synthase), partial [Dinoroseobacter sp.]